MSYTLTAHSGLGRTAAEATALSSQAEADRVHKLGGLIIGSYTHAMQLESEALRYRPGAIAPCRVDGSFHPSDTVGGLALLLPGERLATVAQLLADGLAAKDVADAADGLFGPGGTRMS